MKSLPAKAAAAFFLECGDLSPLSTGRFIAPPAAARRSAAAARRHRIPLPPPKTFFAP
ncbi:MAG: hypothetical protein LBC18_12335 [Opitutaceae bacterium]|jgi:hypothetical protein|nr:hypothetical protein [Opitutaceae bacterium]